MSYAEIFPFLKDQTQERQYFCGLGKTHESFLEHRIDALGIPNATWLIDHI